MNIREDWLEAIWSMTGWMSIAQGHFLLGLQIMVGSFGFWIGLSRLIKTHRNRWNDEPEALETLIYVSCLMVGYGLALFSFFNLIYFYLMPTVPPS